MVHAFNHRRRLNSGGRGGWSSEFQASLVYRGSFRYSVCIWKYMYVCVCVCVHVYAGPLNRTQISPIWLVLLAHLLWGSLVSPGIISRLSCPPSIYAGSGNPNSGACSASALVTELSSQPKRENKGWTVWYVKYFIEVAAHICSSCNEEMMSSGSLMCVTSGFSKCYIRSDILTDNLSLRVYSQTPRRQLWGR